MPAGHTGPCCPHVPRIVRRTGQNTPGKRTVRGKPASALPEDGDRGGGTPEAGAPEDGDRGGGTPEAGAPEAGAPWAVTLRPVILAAADPRPGGQFPATQVPTRTHSAAVSLRRGPSAGMAYVSIAGINVARLAYFRPILIRLIF
jgi:hypothetical protein